MAADRVCAARCCWRCQPIGSLTVTCSPSPSRSRSNASSTSHVFATTPGRRRTLAALAIDWPALKAGDADAGRILLLHLLYAPVRECRRAASHGRLSVRRSGQRRWARCWRRCWKPRAERARPCRNHPDARHDRDPVSQNGRRPVPGKALSALDQPAYARRAAGPSAHSVTLFPGRTAGLHGRAFRRADRRGRHGTARHCLGDKLRPGGQRHRDRPEPPSLAYGKWMAQRLGVDNLTFRAGRYPGPAGRRGPYHIIEAVGVLHHMADPLARLARCSTVSPRRVDAGGPLQQGFAGQLGAAAQIIRLSRPGLHGRRGARLPRCADRRARTDETCSILQGLLYAERISAILFCTRRKSLHA